MPVGSLIAFAGWILLFTITAFALPKDRIRIAFMILLLTAGFALVVEGAGDVPRHSCRVTVIAAESFIC